MQQEGTTTMFGSVFKIRPKAGKLPEIRAAMRSRADERGSVAGWRGAYILEETNGDVWIMAIFDSEESYRKNASDPEQDKAYRAMREMIEADPEWHDGTISEERP
jgi:hypothetical protein